MSQYSKMIRVPFKVSARTARLIGRENVATSKGAVIELVKNGYDADSRYSIIYIDNINSVFPLLHSHFHTTKTTKNSPTIVFHIRMKRFYCSFGILKWIHRFSPQEIELTLMKHKAKIHFTYKCKLLARNSTSHIHLKLLSKLHILSHY